MMAEKRKRMKRLKTSSEESDSSSINSSMSSSSDEETDAKDLKPIKEYLNDRKELASQLFKSVKAEKIRLMLPQMLKRIEFTDLEEFCVNELVGMSKSRIMSIINGQEMLQSSETEDTDNSGPSLEIISDTELISDDEPIDKKEGADSKNSKSDKKSKKKSQNHKKHDPKTKVKIEGKKKNQKTKIKTEKIKTEGKEKEGESILDLLELEMRARAIRALIRKEEAKNPKATQPNISINEASGSGTNDTVARQANLKEQLEKIDVLMKHGDDEDVYVVINPAPTIELLSSEEEGGEQSKHFNGKASELENKKVHDIVQPNTNKNVCTNTEKNKIINEFDKVKDAAKEKSTNIEMNFIDSVKYKETKENKGKEKKDNQKSNLPMSVIENEGEEKLEKTDEKKKKEEEELEEGEIIDNNEEDENKNIDGDIKTESNSLKKKIKKTKKNPHIRSRQKEERDESVEKELKSTYEKELPTSKDNKNKKNIKQSKADEFIEIEDSPERERPTSTSSKTDIFDEKSLDIEEIVNLVDSDSEEEIVKPNSKPTTEEPEKAPSSETWVTRYVQQDEVQNVIKESKIQSEIRKRLRERQRQSKLSNSPKLEQEKSNVEPTPMSTPTGSVEEYLALKGIKKDAESPSSFKEDSSSSFENVDSQALARPVVIVKKPQLNENVVPARSTENVSLLDFIIPEKIDDKILEETELFRRSKNILIKDVSDLSDTKIVIVRQTESTGSSNGETRKIESSVEPQSSKPIEESEQAEKIDSGEMKKNSLPLDDEEPLPGSDSSDDNVIVRIDHLSWTTDEVREKTTEAQNSDLRPD